MNDYQYQKLEMLRDIRTSLKNIEVALRKANGEIFFQSTEPSNQFSLSGNAKQVKKENLKDDIKKVENLKVENLKVENLKDDIGYSSF